MLAKGLPRVTATRGDHEPMAYANVAGFMVRLRACEDKMERLALVALVLTAARSGKVRGATWDEVDLEAGLWSIPAPRMKRKKPHVIPLPLAMVAVFKRALVLQTGDAALEFPGLVGGKSISDATMAKVLKVMGETDKPHGFRSSFNDWAGEVAGFPNELSEAALAHAIPNKAEATYRRGGMLERRRERWRAPIYTGVDMAANDIYQKKMSRNTEVGSYIVNESSLKFAMRRTGIKKTLVLFNVHPVERRRTNVD